MVGIASMPSRVYTVPVKATFTAVDESICAPTLVKAALQPIPLYISSADVRAKHSLHNGRDGKETL